MSKKRLMILINFIWLIVLLLTGHPTKVLSQGNTGYDSYGSYIEEIIIDEGKYREQETIRFKKKHKQYLEMIKENPKDPTPHFYLGSLYLKLDYPQKAIQVFKEYLLLDPFNGEVHFKLGKAFHLVDDGDNAIIQMEKATQIFRHNLDIVWEAKTQQYLILLKKQYYHH